MQRLLFFVCLMPCIVIAQKTLTITVKDRSDQSPLIGALIVDFADWKKGGVSGNDGSLVWTLESKSDTVLISYIGYEDQVVEISQLIKMGGEIYLEPKEASLQEVEIKAERLVAEEFVLKKINRLDIYTNPSAKADPLLAVLSMPSATTLDESSAVSFRGAGPEETGIFFNQIPIYDAGRFAGLNGIGTFSIFNTNLLERVWVFPGNPPLEYGNVTSGLVALETTGRIAKQSSLSVLTSFANVGVTSILPIRKNASITFYANHLFSEGLKLLNPESLNDIRSFGTNEVGALYNHKVGEKVGIRSFLYFTKEDFSVGILTPRYEGDFSQNKQKWMSLTNITGKINKTDELAVNVGFTPYTTRLFYSAFDYEIQQQDIFSSITYSRTKRRSVWKSGVSLDSRYRDFQANVPRYEYADGTQDPVFNVKSVETLSLMDGFVSWSYSPSSRFATGYAIRKNIPLDGQPNFLSIQTSLTIEPWKNHRFTWGRGQFNQIRMTEGGELLYTKSNHRSMDYFWKKTKVEVQQSVYYREVKRNILDDSQVFGVESYVKYVASKFFQFDLSYSGIQAEDKQGKTSRKGQYDLDYFIRGGIQWQKSGWTIGSRYLFRQGTWIQPVIGSVISEDFDGYLPLYSEIQNRRFPYKIIDMNISKFMPLHEHHTLIFFASASNIFNWQNVRARQYNFDFSAYQNSMFNQRTIYAGVTYTFL